MECEGYDPSNWFGDPAVVGGNDCNDNSDVTYPGGAPYTSATACLTDLDGDGFSDRSWSLCPASHTSADAEYRFMPENTTSSAGRGVDIVGDVDGDGLDDIIISDPSAQNSLGEIIGKVYIFLSSTCPLAMK